MEFLKDLDFSQEEINSFLGTVDGEEKDKINLLPLLVFNNIKYLKDLGINNYKEVFMGFSKLFIKENSEFVDIFNKYDTDDLIDKIAKNPAIVEYL